MSGLAWQWRRTGRRVALVPTMGYLHEGHLSLLQRARRAIGPDGAVVVSVYVNPTQFGPGEDLDRYPRDLSRDKALCSGAGVDLVFAPLDTGMYHDDHSTYVFEESLSQDMEGKSRPTHFRGVTTVVTKLFNLVQPELAVFGEKDWQQTAVVRRMVRDLNLPVRLIIAPTCREADGLAMSSRNARLSVSERTNAVVLWEAIQHARTQVRAAPDRVSAARLRGEVVKTIEKRPGARVDYVAFFDETTLQPARGVGRGDRMALAVWIGNTRLIDNGRL